VRWRIYTTPEVVSCRGTLRYLAVKRLGDLVEVDTLDVRAVPTLGLKQSTAGVRVSRWDVPSIPAAPGHELPYLGAAWLNRSTCP
jgi:hypothetical protein